MQTTTTTQGDDTANYRRAALILLCFAACAATSYLISRWIEPGMGTYMFALHGIFAGTLFLTLLARGRNIRIPEGAAKPVIFCGFGTAITPYLVLQGAQSVTPALASVLVISNALLIALFAWMRGRKQFTPTQVVALCIGAAGVVVLSYHQGAMAGKLWGVGTLLAAAFLIASMTTFIEPVTRRYGALSATGPTFVIALGVGIVLAQSTGRLGFYSLSQSALGFLFGVVGLGLPVLLFNLGMARIGAADAANFKLLVPLFALLYGMALLGETPDTFAMVASVIIISSVALYQRENRITKNFTV